MSIRIGDIGDTMVPQYFESYCATTYRKTFNLIEKWLVKRMIKDSPEMKDVIGKSIITVEPKIIIWRKDSKNDNN